MQYSFCYLCGGVTTKSAPYEPQQCLKCENFLYHNSKPTGTALILHNSKLLLIKRGIEPKYGTWDLPGGFSTATETPEETTIREVYEETKLAVNNLKLFHIEIDDYGDSGIKTLNFFYLAKTDSDMAIATDDAMEVVWFDINDLPNEYGFKSVKNCIDKLLNNLDLID